MATQQLDEETKWLSVIGRSLAFLCLHSAEVRDEGLLEQAKILEGLGLSRKDAAGMLNTTDDSLRVLQGRAKRAKGGKGGSKKKAAGKRRG